jgi:hypothetical protein
MKQSVHYSLTNLRLWVLMRLNARVRFEEEMPIENTVPALPKPSARLSISYR